MKIIIDSDMNFPSDDFQAILLLCACRNTQVLAVGAWSEEVAIHLLSISELLECDGRNPKIGRGLAALYWRERHEWAVRQHERGIVPFIGAHGKHSSPRIDEQQCSQLEGLPHAVTVYVDLLEQSREYIEFVCLGPLSNIAQLLSRRPDLRSRIGRITVMGGYFGDGALPPARADFNFWFDANSAHEVLSSGVPLRLVPLDTCRQARCTAQLLDALQCIPDGRAEKFVMDFMGMAKQHGPSMALCDQLTALTVLDPGIVTETKTVGVSVANCLDDRLGYSHIHNGTPTVELVQSVNVARFHEAIVERVRAL
jgi:inosine-uridine nucleoside N-ribohydrolase